MLTQKPRGTNDIFGIEAVEWRFIEDKIRKVCQSFGIREIRTPIFEHTELFLRGVGETTDIVQKEMYTFTDKGNRSITLRPEGTAGAARAFVEHGMYSNTQPTKLFYFGPNFRYEAPQSGRYRQHHQFGAEIYGSYDPAGDAEVISFGYAILKALELTNVKLYINSIGGVECRKRYNERLKQFISENIESFCPTCKERAEKNTLRVLDCKEEKCQTMLKNAPLLSETLGEECSRHFERVQELLTAYGIEYEVDSKLVRGLDYYTKTVFEFKSTDDNNLTVIGGGRYDNLIEECGGPKMGAVGFGMGLERLLIQLRKLAGGNLSELERPSLFIGAIGDRGLIKAQQIVYNLRCKGIYAEADTLGRSVKAQMKYADKISARYSAILGDNEVDAGRVGIKNMETGEVSETALDLIDEFLKR